MRRLAAAVVLAASLAAWTSPAGGHLPPRPGRPCAGETDAVQTSGQWETITSPLDSLTGHAVGGLDGKTVLATDGTKVVRSADGGCTWKPGYDTGPLGGTATRVESLAMVGERSFAVLSSAGGVGGASLLRSTDGGATWRDAGSGLPAVGGYHQLVGLGARLYLTVSLSDDASLGGELYTSADGGGSWARASTGDPILRVAVDPQDARTIYVVRTSHAVERSTDAGATFASLHLPAVPDAAFDPNTTDPGAPDRDTSWRDIAVAHTTGREAVLVVASAPDATSSVTRILASNDSGRSFVDLPTDGLGPIGGLGFGNSPAQILFAAGSDSTAFHGAGLLAYDLGYQTWRDVDDLELGSLREQRSVQLSAALRGHDGYDDVQLRRDAAGKPDLIARYTPPDPPPGDPSLANLGPCGQSVPEPSAGQLDRVAFTPGRLSLSLTPGQPQRVALAAKLRPVPTPLDVDFVIDSSESMDPAIDGVKCSARRISRQLADRGIDAWFGVGTYNDRYDTRFERRLDLAPPGPPLVNALEHLFTRRGKEEPIRTALMQTATGAGLTVEDDNGIGGTATTVVPAGQQADYRDGALHAAIVIGDEPYEDTTPGEPSVEAVGNALKAKGILALGVQVVPPFFQPINARDDGRLAERQLLLRTQLQDFARRSGALAPAGGVDCDGGGSPDVPAGDPLVCPVRQQGIQQSMTETLVALLADLKDIGDVKLVPRTTSGLDVSVEGGALERVDLHRASSLAATAVVGCSAAQAGSERAVSFAVEVGSRVVGELSGTARCGKIAQTARTVPPPHRSRAQPRSTPAKVSTPPAHPAPKAAVVPPLAAPPTPQAAIATPLPTPATPALAPPAPAPAASAASAPASAPAPGAAPSVSPTPGLALGPEAVEPEVTLARVSDGDLSIVPTRHDRRRHELPATAALSLGIGFAMGLGTLVGALDRRRQRALRLARSRHGTRRAR